MQLLYIANRYEQSRRSSGSRAAARSLVCDRYRVEHRCTAKPGLDAGWLEDDSEAPAAARSDDLLDISP